MQAIEALAIFSEQDRSPSISRFLIENGRLPFVDDEVKPWAYRGWLIPYLMMLEAHPDISARYDYVARTISAGELLDEPIPHMRFYDGHEKAAAPGAKMLAEMISITEKATGYSRGFEQVCDWLAFALGIKEEPSTLAEDAQESLYRLFDASKWMLTPSDYLGQYMAENAIGKAAAFFPTPMSVCTMMAEITHADDRDPRQAKAMDCAVGTGRLLLAGSNYCLRLFGQDINYLCVLVCKINLAMFAPWHHIPASYFSDDPPAGQVLEPMTAEKPTGGAGNGQIGHKFHEQETYSTEIEQPMLF